MQIFFEESQGNPFFVEELYRHLPAERRMFDPTGQFRTDLTIDEIGVPENVRLIIGRRLDRFDENARRVLAAVIGRSFSFQLLAEVTQIDFDVLFAVIERAQQMGISVSSTQGPERPFILGVNLWSGVAC